MTLQGRTILITSGPTFAPIDSVRSIVNRSSGRMGCALASECLRQGARVIFCAGYTSLRPPADSENLIQKQFETVDDLTRLIQDSLQAYHVDAIIMAAAVLDYVPDTVYETKKSSTENTWTLTLKRSIKIIEQIRKWDKNVLIVGFKLETQISQKDLIARANDLMKRSDAAMVFANRTEDVSESNHAGFLVERSKESKELRISEPLETREAVAQKIVERLSYLLQGRK